MKAQAAVTALNDRGRGKRRFLERPALEEAVEAILTRYRVPGLLAVRSTTHVQERPLRRYGRRPATVGVERDVGVTAIVDRGAVAAAVRRLGWRVYATNASPAQLSLAQAVRAYRSEYLVERVMGRLKGRPLSLTPMYLERDDHATGLIRLLSVGLRVLTRLELAVRQRLAADRPVLAGLYAGNPKRASARPTTDYKNPRNSATVIPACSIIDSRVRRFRSLLLASDMLGNNPGKLGRAHNRGAFECRSREVAFVAGHEIVCSGFLGAFEESVIGLIGRGGDPLRGADHGRRSHQISQKAIDGRGIECEFWAFEDFGIFFEDRGRQKKPHLLAHRQAYQ